MQYGGIKACPSKTQLLSLLKFEVLNNIVYFGEFLNFTETDLDSYANMKRYSSETVDIVLSALANALRCRILILKKRESNYYIECSDHIINPQHYGALIEESSFKCNEPTLKISGEYISVMHFFFKMGK